MTQAANPAKRQRQVSMVLDLNKCLGCQTCTIACKKMWNTDQGTDYAAVEEGFVSLTPLIVDLTHYGLHQEMKGLERDGLPPSPGDGAR